MNTYKLGSLFDGSGGFPLAGCLCGIEPVWAAEIEPYPIAVTRSRFPNMKHLGSVTDVNGGEIEPVDIITFGSPCQDLSVAGKRAGLKHTENGDEETTRSGLFMEAVRIIKEMRKATNGQYPRFALWENVPGAFSSNKGEDFRVVCEELIKVVEPTAVMPSVPKPGWAYSDSYRGDGWSLSYRVLDAQYWGVPQRRRRIYLVADFAGECAREVLFEREGLRGYFAEGRTPWQGTAGDAENCTGTTNQEGAEDVPYTLEPGIAAREGGHIYEGVSGTLRANAGDNQMAVAYVLDDQGGQQISVRNDGQAPTLRAEMHGNVPCVMEPAVFKADDGSTGDPMSTLTSGDRHAVCYGIDHAITTGGNCTAQGSCVYENIQGTLKASGCHAVAYAMQGFGDYKESEVASGMKARDYKDATDLICQYVDTSHADDVVRIDDVTSPLQARDYKGGKLVATMEQTPVILDRAFFNQGQNAQYEPQFYDDGSVPTLVARGPSAVAYGVDCRNATEQEEPNGCLQAKPNGGFSFNCNQIVRIQYVVRRLTPTECARLQGFADSWGIPNSKDDFTDEEYRFWLNVRNTHAAINGKATKDYTKAQMLNWYNKLHTDSSEYKLWGNGIALPTALYVMQGIAEVLHNEPRN